jgi:hypothetical protein
MLLPVSAERKLKGFLLAGLKSLWKGHIPAQVLRKFALIFICLFKIFYSAIFMVFCFVYCVIFSELKLRQFFSITYGVFSFLSFETMTKMLFNRNLELKTGLLPAIIAYFEKKRLKFSSNINSFSKFLEIVLKF